MFLVRFTIFQPIMKIVDDIMKLKSIAPLQASFTNFIEFAKLQPCSLKKK
jgi:hypothetical protein